MDDTLVLHMAVIICPPAVRMSTPQANFVPTDLPLDFDARCELGGMARKIVSFDALAQ
jgi:hypothetical protein